MLCGGILTEEEVGNAAEDIEDTFHRVGSELKNRGEEVVDGHEDGLDECEEGLEEGGEEFEDGFDEVGDCGCKGHFG